MQSKRRYKILVVDDEEDLRELVMEVLEDRGLEVYGASHGEEAIEKAKKIRPDLILLDVMMPGIDGWEVCRRIKDDPETRGIIVSMLTVKSQDTDKIRSLDYAIADWHISKPVHMDELVKTVIWLLKKPIKREDRSPWESQ